MLFRSPLPDVTALAELEAVARTAFGMVTGNIAALPGTEIGLRLLHDIGLPQPARYVAPSYSTHAAALPGAMPVGIENLCGGGTLLIAEPMAQTPGAERSGDAYFGFYLLAMGTGRPRSVAEIRAMLHAAGFGQVRTRRTALPLVACVITATR